MSKMSQLHAELTEQASELGFGSIGEAEDAGYEIDYSTGRLESPEEIAHEKLMEAKEEILNTIDFVIARSPECRDKLIQVQKFIEQEVK